LRAATSAQPNPSLAIAFARIEWMKTPARSLLLTPQRDFRTAV